MTSNFKTTATELEKQALYHIALNKNFNLNFNSALKLLFAILHMFLVWDGSVF